uniref:Uncharacterized protein LOC114343770 isoform X1 n=1 Tax=Diabrotica virgifera virgifera TaxID=50390 RepID=A0A6P7GL73_DIAVI
METMCGNGSEEIRNQSVSIIKDEQDMFLELEDRSSRSKNILIYNVDESQSKVTNERIDHDKANTREVLTKLEVGATEFKVLRVGRGNSSSDRPRPLKVIFQNNTIVIACLKNKHKLKPSSILIKSDLTQMQRNHLKKLYEELDRRRRNGESNLAIRYKNGNPFISKVKEQNHQSPKNSQMRT